MVWTLLLPLENAPVDVRERLTGLVVLAQLREQFVHLSLILECCPWLHRLHVWRRWQICEQQKKMTERMSFEFETFIPTAFQCCVDDIQKTLSFDDFSWDIQMWEFWRMFLRENVSLLILTILSGSPNWFWICLGNISYFYGNHVDMRMLSVPIKGGRLSSWVLFSFFSSSCRDFFHNSNAKLNAWEMVRATAWATRRFEQRKAWHSINSFLFVAINATTRSYVASAEQ